MMTSKQLWQRDKEIFGSTLIDYWPLWEPSGATILDLVSSARNGSYTNALLAQSGIGDGRTAVHFDGTGYGNVQSAGLAEAFNSGEFTINLWLKWDESVGLDLAYRDAFRFQVNTTNRFYIEKTGTNTDNLEWVYKAGGATALVDLTYVSTLWAGWLMATMTVSKSNDRMRAYLNGVQVGSDQNTLGVWGGSLAQSLLGAISTAPAQPWIGGLARVALGNAELSPAKVARLYNNHPRRLIVFEGDSRTAGTGATHLSSAYPAVAARKLNGDWKCANVGQSGNPVATMITQIAAEVAPLNDPGRGKAAVLWGGVNDNTDAATMHTSISTWCAIVKALGYKVVVCTEIDAQNAGHTDWHNTNYQALNVLIRANYSSYADGLADLGANANLQDATNATYFNADKVHLTDAGYAVVAGIVAAAVNAL